MNPTPKESKFGWIWLLTGLLGATFSILALCGHFVLSLPFYLGERPATSSEISVIFVAMLLAFGVLTIAGALKLYQAKK